MGSLAITTFNFITETSVACLNVHSLIPSAHVKVSHRGRPESGHYAKRDKNTVIEAYLRSGRNSAFGVGNQRALVARLSYGLSVDNYFYGSSSLQGLGAPLSAGIGPMI